MAEGGHSLGAAARVGAGAAISKELPGASAPSHPSSADSSSGLCRKVPLFSSEQREEDGVNCRHGWGHTSTTQDF